MAGDVHLDWPLMFPSQVASPPGRRTGTYFTGDWLGPRASLNTCRKCHLHQDSIPWTLIID